MEPDRDIALECSADTLVALAAGLTGFGAVEGGMDWLIAAVWLCTAAAAFVATAAVEVQSDGFVARPLAIDLPAALSAQLERDLPDIAGRLVSHGSNVTLPPVGGDLAVPPDLEPWPGGPPRLEVVERRIDRPSGPRRVATALLFHGEGSTRLLVGTDPSTMAMVLSRDAALIDRYLISCVTVPAADYAERLRG